MARVKTVLVVDDEPRIVQLARDYLENAGFAVLTAGDGASAVHAFRTRHPDLVVLDLGLPELDGLDVTRAIRGESATPIVMLTARDDELDKLLGLELGADDYITKPFSPRELAARVRTVLRRASGTVTAAEVLAVGAVRVDVTRRRAWAGDAEVSLTSTEFDLLAQLFRRPGRVFERDELLSSVWGYQSAAGTRTVDVHIAQLRAKLGPASPIRTVRGVGYAADLD